MDGDTTFGAWLKSRRRQLDLTQKGLAHQVGCSVGTIRKMEADERRPSRQLAGLLAECLDIPTDQHEIFIAFARSEAYISDTPLPVLPAAEDQVPIIPQETTVPKIKHNLPLAATPFVGREAELAALDELFSDHDRRLVTIVGPGGIGKTRLALAFANLSVNQDVSETQPYKDGVYFVDLSPLTDADRLVFRLAETLNLRIQAGVREKRSPLQQLLDNLQGRHMLLVLDNFEHLISLPNLSETEIETDATALVAEILETAPAVHILVTSRERLNLQVEQIYPIQGLAFPDWEFPENAAEYSAMKLFIQTAQSVQPDFSVAESDWTHLAHICHLVEGMPLGLELAAAWVDMLSLADIAAEIQQSLDFLETELRDIPDRHRSVRATFETSWRKLDQKEQSIFSQLSVFRGGFTRRAAQAVTGAALRQLSRLVNKSFVQFDRVQDRYRIHELLRQYGAERLSRDDELSQSLQDRHISYYCQFLADLTDDLKGARQPQALVAIEADIENVRLAWSYAVTRQNLDAIGISLESLKRFYFNNGWVAQGVKEFEKTLDALRTCEPVGECGIVLGRLIYQLGDLYACIGQLGKAIENAKQSLDLLQRLGARQETLEPLIFLAEAQESPEEGYRLLAECLPFAREIGDPWAIAHVQLRMGLTAWALGDYQQAGRNLLGAHNQYKQNEDVGGVAWTLAHLSGVAVDRGRFQEALSLALECNQVADGLKFPNMAPRAMGIAMYAQGAYDEAEKQFKQGLELVREVNWKNRIPYWLFYLGKVAFRTGDHAIAERQFKESLAGTLAFENPWMVAQNYDALGRLDLVRSEYNQTREHLQAALKTSIPLGGPPLLLEIFATTAELFAKENNLEHAALLATFVTTHPASTARVKERANQLLTRLESQFSSDELEKVRRRSQQSDLDSLAAQLVIDLKKV